jgi:hypothetical protein
VLGREGPRFPFESEAALCLLTIWMLWPNNKRYLTSVARSIGGVITFTSVEDEGRFRKRRMQGHQIIAHRLTLEWYKQFYHEFIQPLGGLQSLINAPSLGALNRMRNERIAQLRLSLDLVDFTVRMARHDPRLATRRTAVEAVARNFYDVQDHYGVPQGEKRTTRKQKADPTSPGAVVSKAKAEKDWDNTPDTIVLLYAFRERFEEVLGIDFQSEGLASQLQELVADRERLTSAFTLYESAMRALEGLPERPAAVQRWRVLRIPDLAPTALPSFSDEQVSRLAETLGGQPGPEQRKSQVG